jgi:tRNA threonylcarbamoyladenosine biosynthesis protein TsaE
MANEVEIDLADEASTLKLGAALSFLHGLIFLRGELGSGKTTLVRGYLQALGHEGPVKSPTYTLIEPYNLAGRKVLHMDIYRLGDPSELEYLGVRDELGANNTLLVEWPERARGYLGSADAEVVLNYHDSGRKACLSATHPEMQEKLIKVISSL